jgi:hypothetical protein
MNGARIAILVLCALLISGCASVEPQAPKSEARLALVLVGGNSECFRDKGIWRLYNGRDAAEQGLLLQGLSRASGIPTSAISTHYFSWTGDPEDHPGCFPGRLGWITGGSTAVLKALPYLQQQSMANVPLVIVGWSNGAATAYEVACTLALGGVRTVDILVTLDPVAWSTDPCTSSPSRAAPPKVSKQWLSVFTESGGFNRFRSSNVIAAFGKAWNAQVPPNPDKLEGLHSPSPLLHIQPADHGHVECMWTRAVLLNEQFQQWATRLGGRTAVVTPTPIVGCESQQVVVTPQR